MVQAVKSDSAKREGGHMIRSLKHQGPQSLGQEGCDDGLGLLRWESSNEWVVVTVKVT